MPWFVPGLGWGRGRGWRWRWCWWFGWPGRGWGWRYWWRLAYLGEPYAEIEKALLKNEAEVLKIQLELIEKRLAQLEQENKKN